MSRLLRLHGLRMPRLNFIRVHYAYVILLTFACMAAISPPKNLAAIDMFFMSVSAATVTGLNTVAHVELNTYQQVVLYLVPMLGQLQFINIMVVLVRLYWFERKFKDIVKWSQQRAGRVPTNVESGGAPQHTTHNNPAASTNIRVINATAEVRPVDVGSYGLRYREPSAHPETSKKDSEPSELPDRDTQRHIAFSDETYNKPSLGKALRIPGPREFENGYQVEEVDDDDDDDEAVSKMSVDDRSAAGPSKFDDPRRNFALNQLLAGATSIERAARSAFIIGESPRTLSRSRSRGTLGHTECAQLPYLSYQPTIGRNSQFLDLSPEQKDELGGVEYRGLRLLAWIVSMYYISIHLLGAICLVAWIYNSDMKYTEYLRKFAVRPVWWAFYSAMTTFNNLGFTLTPDSMIHFRDTTFPMLLMTSLMFIGNTFYPCVLRLIIWIAFRLVPKTSGIQETLHFLLDHPRRCYTLLFPSGPTWALLAVLFFLYAVDVILLIVLDLNNPEARSIGSGWNQFLAALYQVASTRTTGTSTFTIYSLSPAVQFLLTVMMYISVLPIAMSIRKTNTYEESSLGIYTNRQEGDADVDEAKSTSYLGLHLKKQLAFDLWYIVLGAFIILIAEKKRIADPNEHASYLVDLWTCGLAVACVLIRLLIQTFQIFSILFEIVSAYGNVGLSQGYPGVDTALAGQFGTVSKLVLCAMMIRGRHRELPYEIDRAVILPRERHPVDEPEHDRTISLHRRHTQ